MSGLLLLATVPPCVFGRRPAKWVGRVCPRPAVWARVSSPGRLCVRNRTAECVRSATRQMGRPHVSKARREGPCVRPWVPVRAQPNRRVCSGGDPPKGPLCVLHGPPRGPVFPRPAVRASGACLGCLCGYAASSRLEGPHVCLSRWFALRPCARCRAFFCSAFFASARRCSFVFVCREWPLVRRHGVHARVSWHH